MEEPNGLIAEEQQIERWYDRLERYPITLPDPVRYMAARMAVAYGLDPFLGEMVFIPQYKDRKVVGYQPYVGIGGLRRAARRTGEYGGREMRSCTEEERNALKVGPDAHAWFCQVWRKGIVKPFDGFGIFPMHDNDRSKAPPWRMARKRAEHAALRAAFDLELQLMEGNGLVVEVKPIEAEVTELPEEDQDLPEPPREEDVQEAEPTTPQPAAERALEAVEANLEEMQGKAPTEEVTPEEARAILDQAEDQAPMKGTPSPGLLQSPRVSPIQEDYIEGVAPTTDEPEIVPGALHAPIEEPEVVTKSGNIYERLLEDANHNLEQRKYHSRYTSVDEIRQAMEEGGVKGRLLLNEYLNYLTIVLEIKERAG